MTQQNTTIRQRIRPYRTMFTILIVTVLVWCIWVMSETRSYDVPVKMRIEGLDTARYVVTNYDSIINIEVQSDGFVAASLHFKLKHNEVPVFVQNAKSTSYGYAFGISDVVPVLKKERTLPIQTSVRGRQDSLRITLEERSKKPFIPQLRDVQFSFANHYGLNGNPIIIPDTVWLYGSEQSLARIEALYTSPAVVTVSDTTASYELPLSPVWEEYLDVRPSVEKISIYVPVGQFSEKTFEIPLKLIQEDTNVNIRIYPDRVKVKMLVEKNDYRRLSIEDLTAEVRYENQHQPHLQVIMSRFPEYARVKQIDPQIVEYVIIK